MTNVPSAELVARYHHSHEETAAEELFRRYAERLTALARGRLSASLAARVDAEDVVQSAYRSFFLLVRDGEVVLQASGDLWRLLVRITLRKVYRNARRHRADRRSVARDQAWTDGLEAIAHDREPTPAEAAALVDELREVLTKLGVIHRRIVQMRLQGHEVEAIAAEVQRSGRTVRRVLAAVGEELEGRLCDTAPPTAEERLLAYSDVVLQRQLGQGAWGRCTERPGKAARYQWPSSSSASRFVETQHSLCGFAPRPPFLLGCGTLASSGFTVLDCCPMAGTSWSWTLSRGATSPTSRLLRLWMHCAGSPRPPRRSNTPIKWVWSTATLSQATCSWGAMAMSASPTSGWPGC
jgi:RNA polymerase sigma factor (sigma-70 family)